MILKLRSDHANHLYKYSIYTLLINHFTIHMAETRTVINTLMKIPWQNNILFYVQQFLEKYIKSCKSFIQKPYHGKNVP